MQEEMKMFRAAVAGALVCMSAVMIASAQTAPQKPGPLDNLVPTPHPQNSGVQADLEVARDWRRAMREIFELPPNYRLVFLDGRPHPPDVEPTWKGAFDWDVGRRYAGRRLDWIQ
jgi:hypothetical protein